MSQTRAVNSIEETVYIQKATEMEQAGECKAAIDSIEEGLSKFPSSEQLLQKKSQLLLNDKKYKQALDVIEQMDQASFDLQFLKGKALFGLNKSEEALEIYLDLKDNSCYNIEQANALDTIIAKIYLDQAKFDEALKLYKLLLKSNITCEESLKAIWFIYEVNGDHEASIEFHNELLESNAYNFRAWYNLGHACRHLNKLDDAILAFEMCLTLDDQNVDANWFLAACLKTTGNYEKAIRIFNRHYELVGEEESATFIELAECHLALENFSFTYYYASRYEAFDDSSWETYLYKGLCLVHFANHKEAIENYKKALKINPKESKLHSNIGLAYYHCGEHKKSFEHLIEAMDLEPENIQLWCLAIEFLIRHNEIKPAIHLCNNAFEVFEDNDLQVFKAACYFIKGDSIMAYNCMENFDSVTDDQFKIILSICPFLYEDQQFKGFYRFCKNLKELPVIEQGSQDLPDGYFEFE